ncbi:hypothetical protein TNCV_4795431 [Trichonephila clavipes]|nr:hypothetical protein TNCV_4795431 [Trichonephila clavipes]
MMWFVRGEEFGVRSQRRVLDLLTVLFLCPLQLRGTEAGVFSFQLLLASGGKGFFAVSKVARAIQDKTAQ